MLTTPKADRLLEVSENGATEGAYTAKDDAFRSKLHRHLTAQAAFMRAMGYRLEQGRFLCQFAA
jgi:hypothetical protein